MRYTYAVEKAIRAASVLHLDHVREGSVQYPYITHLFAVAMITSDYVESEDAIVSALLHDTLSYTDYTEKELENDFGSTVREIVVSITEPSQEDVDEKATREAKKVFLKKLKDASEVGLIVLAADKIHTMRTIVEEYAENISAYISDFGSHQDIQLFFYQEISNVLNRRLQSAILAEFNDVFTEYKNFTNAVKKKIESH